MPKKKQQPEDFMDQVVKYILWCQKQKPPKKPGKPLPVIVGTNEMADLLGQIALRPQLYPISQGMNEMTNSLARMLYSYQKNVFPGKKYYQIYPGGKDNPSRAAPTDISTEDAKLRFDPAQTANFLFNPRKYMASVISAYRAERAWERIGGGTKLVDGTILSVIGRGLGLDKEVTQAITPAFGGIGGNFTNQVRFNAIGADTADEAKTKILESVDNAITSATSGSDEERNLLAFKARLQAYGDGTSWSLPGAIVGKTLFLGRWVSSMASGDFLKGLATGGLVGEEPLGLVRKYKIAETHRDGSAVLDTHGDPVSRKIGWGADAAKDLLIQAPTQTAAGRGIGNFLYYAHPVNLLKGIFLDGRYWFRLAMKFDDASGMFVPRNWSASKYFLKLWEASPANAISRLKASAGAAISTFLRSNKVTSPFVKIASKIKGGVGQIFSFVNAQRAKLINAIVSKLSAALKVSVPGIGFAVGLAVDFVLSKFAPVVEGLIGFALQFAALLIIGAIALLMIIPGAIGSLLGLDDAGLEYIYPNTNPPILNEPSSGGSEIPPYEGFQPVYSGNAAQIFQQVATEMNASVSLNLVECGGADCHSSICNSICGTENQNNGCSCNGAWCYSGYGTVHCIGSALSGASDETLTRLFRHEISHQLQANYSGDWNQSGREGWDSEVRRNVTEWGADYISGNGGHYCFHTIDGRYMSGAGIGDYLSSVDCPVSLLTQAAYGDYNALIEMEGSCGYSPRTYIYDRTIGGSCSP